MKTHDAADEEGAVTKGRASIEAFMKALRSGITSCWAGRKEKGGLKDPGGARDPSGGKGVQNLKGGQLANSLIRTNDPRGRGRGRD